MDEVEYISLIIGFLQDELGDQEVEHFFQWINQETPFRNKTIYDASHLAHKTALDIEKAGVNLA